MAQLECFPLRRGPLGVGTGLVGGWRITSYFGGRPNPFTGQPSYHSGMDLAGPIHLEPLYSVVEGTPYQGWDGSGGGNWTTLYHRHSGARFGYGHAHHFEPGVHGILIPAGRVIAYVDSSGASTGDHLHFAYDSEDANTSYDDPYDILMECAEAGRFPGSITPPQPPQPPEGFTMEQYQEIMAGINRIEGALGLDLAFDVAAHEQLDRLEKAATERGWASRPYLFQLGVKNADESIDVEPEVYNLDTVDHPDGTKERVRMHVTTQRPGGDPVAFMNVMIQLGYNPHLQVITDPVKVEELRALRVANRPITV